MENNRPPGFLLECCFLQRAFSRKRKWRFPVLCEMQIQIRLGPKNKNAPGGVFRLKSKRMHDTCHGKKTAETAMIHPRVILIRIFNLLPGYFSAVETETFILEITMPASALWKNGEISTIPGFFTVSLRVTFFHSAESILAKVELNSLMDFSWL